MATIIVIGSSLSFTGCTIDKNKNPPIYGEFNIVNVTSADQAAEINKAPNLNDLSNNPGSSQGGVTNKNQTKGPTSGNTTTTKKNSKSNNNNSSSSSKPNHTMGGKGGKTPLSKEEQEKRERLNASQTRFSKVALHNKGKSGNGSSGSSGNSKSVLDRMGDTLNSWAEYKDSDKDGVWKINEGDAGLLKQIKRGVNASAKGLEALGHSLNPLNWFGKK